MIHRALRRAGIVIRYDRRQRTRRWGIAMRRCEWLLAVLSSASVASFASEAQPGPLWQSTSYKGPGNRQADRRRLLRAHRRLRLGVHGHAGRHRARRARRHRARDVAERRARSALRRAREVRHLQPLARGPRVGRGSVRGHGAHHRPRGVARAAGDAARVDAAAAEPARARRQRQRPHRARRSASADRSRLRLLRRRRRRRADAAPKRRAAR